MPSLLDRLYDIAETQAGYFTTAQAAAAGVSRQALRHHLLTGSIERLTRGVYRLRRYPPSRFEDLAAAVLAVGDDAAVSHETALAVYDLAGAMPAHIHVTVPRRVRTRRPGVVVHVAALPAGERTVREAVPVTTAERTLCDVVAHSDPDMVRSAAREALERGLTTRRRLLRALAGRPDAQAALGDALGGSLCLPPEAADR